MAEPARYYTVKAVAEIFNVSPATIYHLCREGRMTFLKIRQTFRIPQASVDAFVNKQTIVEKEGELCPEQEVPVATQDYKDVDKLTTSITQARERLASFQRKQRINEVLSLP